MSRDRNIGMTSKKASSDDGFKSPISWGSRSSLVNIDLTENKRARTDIDDNDTESGTSGITGTKKKFRKALDRTLKSGDPDMEATDNEWADIDAIKNSNKKRKNNNAEILESMNSLKITLNKLRYAGKELTKYFSDVPVYSRATGKMLAGNVERYASTAIETHRKLELLREIEELRFRDSSTQMSPRIPPVTIRETPSVTGPKNKTNTDSTETQLKKPITENFQKNTDRDSEKWTTVDTKSKKEQKKKAIKNRKDELDREKAVELEARALKRRENAIHKTDAVIIKASEGETYSDILKNLRTKVGRNLVGVQAVRRSRGLVCFSLDRSMQVL